MTAIDQDFVRGIIERHSDASGGNGRDFHNGAYAAMADEIEQAVAATLGPCSDSCNCTNSERTETCELVNAAEDLGDGTSSCMCDKCGYTALDDWWDEFNFCPNCGAKIVDPTINDVDAEVDG